jgi:membrane protease YdiL (CAAX protease family)
MGKQIFKDLILFTFSLIVGLLLASMATYLFLYLADSINLILKTRLQAELNLKEINILKITQLFYSILAFGGASMIFSFYKTGNLFIFFTSKKNPLKIDFIHLVPLLILFYPIVIFSAEINQLISFPENLKHFETLFLEKEEEAKWLTKTFLNANNTLILAFNFLVIAIAPSIFEEILFRGCLQKSMYKTSGNIILSIVISAFIFSAIHFQFYGFLPRFLLGALLGWVYYITGNIAYPILLHIVNNGSQVLLVYFISKYNLPWDVYEPEAIKLIPTVISTVLFIILASQFKVKYQSKNE